MQSQLHENVVSHGVELLLLVSMLFLLATPISVLFVKKYLFTNLYISKEKWLCTTMNNSCLFSCHSDLS